MENQSYPIAKHSLIYGVYTSIVLIILTLIFYVLNLHTARWPGYISYVFLCAGVVFASLQYRDKRLGGFATYGQSFSSGFMAGLFASIIMAIFTYIYITMLGESFTADLLQQAENNMLEARPNMSDEELDMAMKITRNMMKPLWMTLIALISFTFLSLVFSLIASIFIKKEKPEGAGV